MPYFWRPWYRRRRRRLWRRRTRGPFRRRRYWRRRYWVRKPRRKLKKITLSQWQPTTINKLKVTGQYPLYEGTNQRIGNDNTQYIDSIAPYLVPGGGCFSITVFTLEGLYELHQKGRNWWTKSNCQLPLIKYLGCKFKLFRSINSDYVTVYARCGEMKATEQLYQSCQPSVLMLNKHKKIVTCKKDNHQKRPYKTIKVKPPALMINKWYFQQELAQVPLVMLITSAASLDRYFISSNAISSTIGFKSLNTDSFQFHNFKQQGTQPYKPNERQFLYTTAQHTTVEQATFKELILLGNTKDNQPGRTIQQTSDSTWTTNVDRYFSTPAYWGNPFYSSYFNEDAAPQLITEKTIDEVKTLAKANNGNDKITDKGFTTRATPTYWDCRYNPQADMGHNAIFLARITDDRTAWHEPHEVKLLSKGLPLWLLIFGWTDWIEKAGYAQHKDTDYVLVIVSDYISPKKDYYVPLDFNFLNGRSPHEETEHIKPYDQQNWHPKLNFQSESIATITNTGPATVKLPPKISTEAHCTYTFYFKLGGCPPPMDDVCDPKKQPQYPTPGNFISTTLLQNPETPMQYYLSSFDQRRDTLTKKAAKRIKTDYGFKETFFKPTGTTSLDIQTKTPETTSTEDSSEEEKDEETLQFNLKRQRRKQRKLKQRILQLLHLAQKLE
nr:MAG: ORF1 [TTV-like mini virus]